MSSLKMNLTVESVKEIKIPVPWGYIAAKTWGNKTDTPVLIFHGLLDNAGSFDRLIPFLSNSFYYICVDLPGHGFSSHFPPHIPVSSLNYVLTYKLIMDYFKRQRYIVIGHSYGGQLGFLFTQLYPQYVDKLILLDTISLIPVQVEEFKSYLIDVIESHIRIEEKLKSTVAPSYTYEEALARLINGRTSEITTEAATALLPRSVEPVENNRFRFIFDQRVKNYINLLRDFEHIIEFVRHAPVPCPVLIILGSRSIFQQQHFKSVISYFRQMKNITIRQADGYHDVHNDSPELVAPYINSFLSRRKAKL